MGNYNSKLTFDIYYEYRYKILNDLLDRFLSDYDFKNKENQLVQNGKSFTYSDCGKNIGLVFWFEDELNKFRVIFDYVNETIIIESDSNTKMVKDVYNIVDNYVKIS